MRSRQQILKATREVIGTAGFDGVTIAAVAKQADVSRQTVYSIFGTREDLVSQAVSERLTELVGAVNELIESAGSPLELLVEVMIVSRAHILGDPLLRVLTLSGDSNPIFDPGAAERANEYVTALLAPAADRFPAIGEHLGLVADIGVHVGWSVLCLDRPAARSDDQLREFLRAWLGPILATIST